MTEIKTMNLPILVLGSSSPRRRELLSALGLQYQVLTPGIDEIPRQGESPQDYVLRNAVEKGAAVLGTIQAKPEDYRHGVIVISADTIVVLDEDILEKPLDAEHAASMLERLSGRTHTVYSGVSLRSWGTHEPREVQFVATTQVYIKNLTPKEIRAYIRTGEPFDKAGGYAAQGMGSYMVERIEGSYANVVGLPISEVARALSQTFAYPLWEE
jgi:septum formation protein